MLSVSLDQLWFDSQRLLNDRTAFAPALDWVEQILPRLPAACRQTVCGGKATTLDAWLDWARGSGFEAIAMAGKGVVFAWRQAWVMRFLEVTRELQRHPSLTHDQERRQFAEELARHEVAGLSLPPAFWRCLIDYLLTASPHPAALPDEPSPEPNPLGSGRQSAPFHVPFPCILSEWVVIDGAETDVLFALFTVQRLAFGTGEVFLHPDQIALRCMDATFADCFAHAAAVVRQHLADSGEPLADYCLRLYALRPDQESFLQGILLRGSSGSGALALTLCGQQSGLKSELHTMAASFALDTSSEGSERSEGLEENGAFHCLPVNGAAEKVRGCARQRITRLLVAASQQSGLALYGRRNGVEIIGVQTFAEAFAHICAAHPGAADTEPTADGQENTAGEEGGIVPPASRYYVTRPQDRPFYEALHKRPMLLLVKGPRQIGKSSLLVRGVNQARAAGYRVVWTDLQKLNTADLASLPAFYIALANMLTRQLKLSTLAQSHWNEYDSPNMNFEYFLLDHVLERVETPIVWFLDEVDRLFTVDFYSEVFSLMRSWHNDRGVQPLWQRLTLALGYTKETHLFIKNPFQSPFNVGARFELEAFTHEEVSDLNARYDSPLKDASELARYYQFTGGHPYLTQRGYAWMAKTEAGLDAFDACALNEDGPLGDHLRRLGAVVMQPGHAATLTRLLEGENQMSLLEFYRLRSAGILTGNSPAEAALYCGAYAGYLRRCLIR